MGILLAVLVGAGLLALDSYRNLGHSLTTRYLLTRYGSGGRTTVALLRTGVIGWTVSQSYLQRRFGLITLTATTAASHGDYRVIEVAMGDGLALAGQAVPGLLADLVRPELLGSEPARHAD